MDSKEFLKIVEDLRHKIENAHAAFLNASKEQLPLIEIKDRLHVLQTFENELRQVLQDYYRPNL